MLLLLVVQILPLLAAAHIEMSWPYPMRSRFDPRVSEAQKRYDMTSPLLPDGSDFPCKGYQKDLSDWGHAPALAAGSTYNMSLAGSANHGGGSCQISLSYDNGATFKVIKSIIGGCPLQATYSYTVPRSAPNGNALLAWTWQNLIGNREYYMNCAQVKTMGGDGQRADFDNLPFLWKANLVAVSNCTTSENVTPVYPRPGVDVEYGSGLGSSSPPSPGICDSADISPPIASSPVCSEHDSVA